LAIFRKNLIVLFAREGRATCGKDVSDYTQTEDVADGLLAIASLAVYDFRGDVSGRPATNKNVLWNISPSRQPIICNDDVIRPTRPKNEVLWF
jgi:hypothetical protein